MERFKIFVALCLDVAIASKIVPDSSKQRPAILLTFILPDVVLNKGLTV